MKDYIVEKLKELVQEYGVAILGDPDRLSQFLEGDTSEKNENEIFNLTFALHSIIRSGWTPHAEHNDVKRNLYIKRLHEDLAYNEKDAADFINALDMVISQNGFADTETDAIVAHPGNLRRISGGIANNPRTGGFRKKALYNGIILFAAFLAIILLFSQIARQNMPESNEFRIAFFAPLSGDVSQYWHRQLKAAQLAVERVNSEGGVRGFKLKLIGYDVPDDPQKVAKTVEKIMKDKNLLVMLTGLSGKSAKKLAELADRMEIPLLLSCPELTKDCVTDEAEKPYLYSFRISNIPAETAQLMAYYAKKGLGARKVALYYNENDKYSVEACEELQKRLNKYSCRIVAALSYTNQDADYTLALKTIKAAKVDVLILPGNTKYISNMLQQAKTVDFNGKILGANFYQDKDVNPEECIENSWWINRLERNDPQIMSVLKAYKQLYNEACPSAEIESAMLMYDSVRWIAAAFYRAPGYRGEAVRHGLLSTRNLALTHATVTTDPRTHGPLDKACALVKTSGCKGIFQRRLSLKTDL